MDQVTELFRRLFDASDWPPRWHCGRWTGFHGWLYIISDLLIWSAYFAIPIVIIRYISRRRHARFIRIYYLFAAFILSCGATHFLDAAAFWVPAYRLSALVRFITAVLSWITVFSLVRLLPVAFSLRTQKELELEITQRREAEEQILQLNATLEKKLSEERAEIMSYKYALDESCIVAITDQKGIIRYVNDNFCKISKYNANELLGQDHRIINSGHHSREFIRHLWVTIANGKIWKGELKNRAKDGTIYWVDTTIVPFLNEQGKPYQYLAIRADITERKRAEDEVRQLNETLERKVTERTRELELSYQEAEAFSYTISHDLRAPLRVINGYAAMLEEDYAGVLDDNGKRLTGIVRQNVMKMSMLIDDLLSFAKLGRKEINKSEVDMTGLINELIDEIDKTMPHRARIKVQQLPPAMADKTLIRQAMANYLLNAVKYSSKSADPIIEVRSDRQVDKTIYIVRDNGTGFDMSYAHKLFGVFQRLHGPNEFEGTGVGLAIVKRIITRHGGEVWAEGETGKGAAFYFSLPC